MPASAHAKVSFAPLISSMSLVLVANRAPVRPTPGGWVPALGGLATALLPVLEKRGGAWVAMRATDEQAPLRQPYPEAKPRFTIHRVALSDSEFDGYYNGMANRVLWPLMHYLIEHAEPNRDFWRVYRTVNGRFAEAALAAAEEINGKGADRPTFWVQDYHLMLVPELLRHARPESRIGLFWHIPWPAPEVYRVLPAARPLLRGMLGADLVGFHTPGYAENFRRAAKDLLGAGVEGTTILWEGRRIDAEPHPIGINHERFEELRESENVVREAQQLRDALGVERLVVAVDRLDYTKGLLLRLDAFQKFLDTYPEYQGRVTLFQVATPSRTGIESYDQLKAEVDEAIGRINGAYARGTWEPIRYRYRAYPQEELAVLYRAADVALITPLRDGMNLVAQEFAATAHEGALVLSDLTGAADYLDGAILTNPYDTEGLPRALHTALEMPVGDRLERLERLRDSVRRLDVHRWAEGFLETLAGPNAAGGDGAPTVPAADPVSA
jgi:trehalose 6-phosphate synthase/phosphatase